MSVVGESIMWKFKEIRGNSRGTSMEGFQDTNRNEVSLCKLV